MKKLFSVRTIILAGSLLLQLNTLCFHSRGAAGDVDLSFDPGSGVNGPVNAVLVQPDGKVIIGGNFTTVKGLARPGIIARLNADGSGDVTFDAGAGPNNDVPYNNSVSSLALQSDGKVLIGGYFTTVNGTNRNGIARLNANGSLDTSFNPGTGVNGGVFSITLQPDGKVVIGGGFTTVNGTNLNRIARLNANGSLDSSFNPGTGANGSVFSIALQPDGKVVIGGAFYAVNGTFRNNIARLNANGSLDGGFNPGTGDYSDVRSVALQPDGKVLIGGVFTTVNGTNRNGIARLNANGTLDSSFDPGIGPGDGFRWAESVIVQSDGKVLIRGHFTMVDGANRIGMARLNASGSPDNGFNPNFDQDVSSVTLQPDGRVLIGGSFSHVNGTNRNNIARLNVNGSVDSSFDPGAGLESSISSLVAQPNGKVLIGGVYTFINGTNRYGSQLNADGSRDSTFIPGSFNPNLSVFVTDWWSYVVPISLLVQSDGKVLIGGYIDYVTQIDEWDFADAYAPFLARFNANGSLDGSFNGPVLTGDYPGVCSLAVQADGKVLIGGWFTVNGTNSYNIARLNADGSLDSSFNLGTVAYGSVNSIVVRSDGKVLIGGDLIYNYINDTNYNSGIARLNANGSLDSTFNPGRGIGVASIAVQSDGKILIGGYFTAVNGTNRNNIARLNANGSPDSSFNPGTGTDGWVRSIALQSDGNVLIGGDFTIVNGAVRPRVARLYGDSAPSLNIARSNAFVIVSWPVTGLNFQLQETTDLSLPNAWSLVAQPAVTNVGRVSVTVPTTVGPKFFLLKSK